MATSTVHVEGLDNVLRNLKALPKEMVSKSGGPAKTALRKAANVIRDEAEMRAPKDSGFMASQIVSRRDSKPQLVGATEHYWVGVKGGGRRKYANTRRNRAKNRAGATYAVAGNAYYWRFVEFGTEKWGGKPFLRPAFESKKGEALDTFVREINAGIDKIVAKMRKR